MCLAPVPDSWRGSVNMQRDLDMIQRVNRGKEVREQVHTTYKNEDGYIRHHHGKVGGKIAHPGLHPGEGKRRQMLKRVGAKAILKGIAKTMTKQEDIITD